MCFQRSSERIEEESRPPKPGWKVIPQSRTGSRETPVAKFVVCSWHEQLPDVVGMRPQQATTSIREKMTVVSKIHASSTREHMHVLTGTLNTGGSLAQFFSGTMPSRTLTSRITHWTSRCIHLPSHTEIHLHHHLRQYGIEDTDRLDIHLTESFPGQPG